MTGLRAHKNRLSSTDIRDLFAADPKRFSRFSISLGPLLYDYSKNRIDDRSMKALVAMAKSAGVERQRKRMFSGAAINETEGRAALHTALRARGGEPVLVDGKDVLPEVDRVRRAACRFAHAVRSGKYQVTGGRITDVVNIGIGGSDLGPAMAVEALSPYRNGPRCRFVSNVDGADLADTLKGLDPATTLFIVASKTFTTQETMRNARSARHWLKRKLKSKDTGRHFAALSTNLEATRAFGIDDDRTFAFWDWVGGRYSVWSAIGLSLMIAIGPKRFADFLAGARAVDEHFCSAPLTKNLPVIMALIGVWHRNVCRFNTQAILPYDNRLDRFPAYLQQLEMESNGKSVMANGRQVKGKTSPVIWGEPGTNSQHAFFQLIHQGTDIIPCDFLVAVKPQEKLGDHHEMLVANCLAQTKALMGGKTMAEATAELIEAGLSKKQAKALAPHKVFEGNRPSSTFLYRKLDPFMLGMLVALYEHKVFVQGVIWGINSFDQWGVELGKTLARELTPMVKGEKPIRGRDGSTMGLLRAYHKMRG